MNGFIQGQLPVERQPQVIIADGDWNGGLPAIDDEIELETLGKVAVGVGLTVAAIGAGILIYNAFQYK